MTIQELMEKIPQNQNTNSTASCLNEHDLQQKKLEWANESAGKLQGEQCPICKNKGFVLSWKDGYLVSTECKCMAKRRSLRRIEKSGLASMLDRYKFDTYKTDYKWQNEAKNAARRFVSDSGNDWFLISGTTGAGKTHLCTAICGGFLDAGKEVHYMLWRDHGTEIKASITNAEKYSELVKPLKTVPILYIDDFFKAGAREGKLKVTDADIQLAYTIINARYMDERLKTIISTELSIEEIIGLDASIGGRIYEKCERYYLRISGDDKNLRLRG